MINIHTLTNSDLTRAVIQSVATRQITLKEISFFEHVDPLNYCLPHDEEPRRERKWIEDQLAQLTWCFWEVGDDHASH